MDPKSFFRLQANARSRVTRKSRQKLATIEYACDEADQDVGAGKGKLERSRRNRGTQEKGSTLAKSEGSSKLLMDKFSGVGPEKFGR
jgi:hypothetical protein